MSPLKSLRAINKQNNCAKNCARNSAEILAINCAKRLRDKILRGISRKFTAAD
jgi:hypothetical protein